MCYSWEYGKPMRTEVGTRREQKGPSAARAVASMAVASMSVVAALAAVSLSPATASAPVPSATTASPAHVATLTPAPADLVRETGSWFAHGYTLDLRPDGTGTVAVWIGATDGHRLQLRLIPAPGEATVAEVVAVETVGGGALGPDELPGMGGLVTIAVGRQVRTAHVEWSSGPRRLSVDLCPAEGLDTRAMEALRCGA